MVFKKCYLSFFLVISGLFFTLQTYAAGEPGCTVIDGEIQDTDSCKASVQEITFTIKGIWFCWSEPRAPTTTTANPSGNAVIQITGSGCTQRKYPKGSYTGDTSVTIGDGLNASLKGGMSGIVGTQKFQYIALELEPVFDFKGTYKFSSPVKDIGTSSDLGKTGEYCWTVGGTIYTNNSGANQVDCGSSDDASSGTKVTSYFYNQLGSATSYDWIMSNGRSAKAYLIDSENKLLSQSIPDASGRADSIFVILQNPLTHYSCKNKNKGTSGMTLSWNISSGMRIEWMGGEINQLAPDQFDFFMEPVLRSGGSC